MFYSGMDKNHPQYMEYLMIIIGFLAVIGLIITIFLRWQKVKRRPVKCLFKEECNKVLDSKYATFFNLPTELMGMLYYALLLVGIGATWWITSELVNAMMVVAATLAVIFSLRQIFMQAVVLRAWCSWCLATAFLNAAIFALLLYAITPEGIVALAENFRSLFLPIHLITAVMALAMATLSDFLFFRFLKDFWISEHEAKFLDRVSEVIWFLVVLFLVSGAAVYLSNMARYNASPKFWVKMIVVAVILVNGLALSMYLSPKLKEIPFHKKDDHLRSQQGRSIRRARTVMFALGPVSIVSWYSAMALGFIKQVPFGLNFWQLLGVYAVLLACGILGGQIMGKIIYRAKRRP